MITENLEAEYKIFFCLFSSKKEDAIRVLLERGVTSDYFGAIFHREIFEVIYSLYKQSKMVSLGTFKTYFLNRVSAVPDDEIKFTQFVRKVKESSVPLSDLPQLTNMLIEAYVCRKTLFEIDKALNNKEKKSVLEILTDLECHHRMMKSILEPGSIRAIMGLKDGLERRIERAKQVYANPDDAGMVLTGLKNLDNYIGRQSPGQLVIYQARTGVGKSMMLMGTALSNFKKGLKVIVITIEMSNEEYLYRFDSNLTGIQHREFTSGEITNDNEKLEIWRQKILNCGKAGSDLMVYWVPSNCTPSKVESIVASNPFKPDLVIVDYAGDMKAGLKGIPDYSATAHGEIYSSLKELAGKYECVVYTAQQSKRGTKGKADTESGSWSDVASNKADLMLAVEVTKEDEDFMTEVDGSVIIGRMTVSIIKGRNVPKCKTHIIPRFHKMTWIEKLETEMIPVGTGKEFKTDKQEKQDKIKKANDDMEKAIDFVPDNVADLDLDSMMAEE